MKKNNEFSINGSDIRLTDMEERITKLTADIQVLGGYLAQLAQNVATLNSAFNGLAKSFEEKIKFTITGV